MAELYVAEFENLAFDQNGKPVLTGKCPPLNEQKKTFTTSAAVDTAFNNKTRFVRIMVDADAHIAFGTSPTATTSNMPISANTPEYFGVNAGHKVAAVAQ